MVLLSQMNSRLQDESDLPYRNSAVTHLAAVTTPDNRDDIADYDTLRSVRASLAGALLDLKSDFNILEIDVDKLPPDQAIQLLHDIKVKQGVYAIVAPILEAVDASIMTVDEEWLLKQQQQ